MHVGALEGTSEWVHHDLGRLHETILLPGIVAIVELLVEHVGALERTSEVEHHDLGRLHETILLPGIVTIVELAASPHMGILWRVLP